MAAMVSSGAIESIGFRPDCRQRIAMQGRRLIPTPSLKAKREPATRDRLEQGWSWRWG